MTPQDPIYSLPTTVGAAKLAYAMANQLTVDISHMAIGDGNGVAVNPTAAWPALAREVHRAQLNQLYQHPTNPNWLVAELVLPAEVGGWTIREIGLYDVDGDLIFIGNHAEQYKPVQSQGSDETKTIRMVVLVSSTSTVTLKTDPTTVMATVDYVQRELAKLDQKQSVRYTTTAAVVLSGLGVQAGGDWAAALTAGDRVLVKNQALAKDNGIYVVAGGAWVRATDADLSAEVTSGLVVAVEQGATLADTRWQLVTDGAIVLGTTSLAFQNVTQGYAPLASPAMTGNPTAPTPAQFDNDTSVATTEFVQRASGNKRAWVGINANTALSASHVGAAIGYLTGSTVTATLPAASGLVTGSSVSFYNNTSVDQIVAAAGTDTIAFGSTSNGGAVGASFTIPPGCTATFLAISASAWHVPEGTATLSGTKQPTPTQFDNDNSLATTEFVQRAIGSRRGCDVIAASRALTLADVGCVHLVSNPGGATTLTLPSLASLPPGASITLLNLSGGGPVTVVRQGADQIVSPVDPGGLATSFVIPYGASIEFTNYRGIRYMAFGVGDSPYLLASTGYEKRPCGLIRQWGTVTQTTTANGFGPVTVTLPVAFTTAITGIGGNLKQNGILNGAAPVNVDQISLSQIAVTLDYSSGSEGTGVSRTVYWWAEGY